MNSQPPLTSLLGSVDSVPWFLTWVLTCLLTWKGPQGDDGVISAARVDLIDIKP